MYLLSSMSYPRVSTIVSGDRVRIDPEILDSIMKGEHKQDLFIIEREMKQKQRSDHKLLKQSKSKDRFLFGFK